VRLVMHGWAEPGRPRSGAQPPPADRQDPQLCAPPITITFAGTVVVSCPGTRRQLAAGSHQRYGSTVTKLNRIINKKWRYKT
jgi:hypothetical protein